MESQHATSLLILSLAFLIPLLSERIHLPAAVGEIIFGVIISTHGLNLITPSPFLRFLADFGFAFLMFLVGMEIDFSRIESMGRKGLGVAAAAACGIFVLAAGSAYLGGQRMFLALALGATSLGLVLVALKDAKLTQTRLGQIILLVGSIGEFLSIILLTGADMALMHGFSMELLWAMGKLAAIFVLAYLLLVLLRTLVWWYPNHFERLVTTHDASEVGVRASFALMLSFVAVAALLGVETILGAFLAGALFSFVFREKEAVETKLSSFGFGFFIPIFFIDVGMGFDFLGILKSNPWADLGFLAAGSLVAKMAPMFLLLLLGLSVRAVLASGIILAAPLTLLVAIAKIGQHLKIFDQKMAGTIVLFALLGGVVFPLLFKLVLGKSRDPETTRDH